MNALLRALLQASGRRKLPALAILGVAVLLSLGREHGLLPGLAADGGSAQAQSSDALLAQAFEQRRSDLQVEGAGRVVKVLPDDTKGSQHQRFLLELATGQTLLVAHNIDLAPRVANLREGDALRFYGEYEWTEKGGVIHWTHHDPRGSHADGWLEHKGQRYD